MKKQLTTILLVLVCFSGFAQVTFEKGYYINNNDQKIECLIKNLDWSNNPTSFQFKISENSDLKTVTIKEVKEFSVYNSSKFLRATVKIDRSTDDINSLSSNRNINFAEEELFLKVLVEGDATLYNYQNGNLTRFFFKKENSEIGQLIYKRYLVTPSKVGKNNQYQQQLWNSLKCQELSIKDVEKLDYKASKLISFFVKYNKCNDSGYINNIKEKKKTVFNITLRSGITSNSITTKTFLNDTPKSNTSGYRLGLEIELMLGGENQKWALITEPNYHFFREDNFKTIMINSFFDFINNQTVYFATDLITKAEYASLALPIGIRHYFVNNQKSKLYANTGISINLMGDLKFNDLKLSKGRGILFGLGYKYNDKYNIELRYVSTSGESDRSIGRLWKYTDNSLSIIFGYKIF